MASDRSSSGDACPNAEVAAVGRRSRHCARVQSDLRPLSERQRPEVRIRQHPRRRCRVDYPREPGGISPPELNVFASSSSGTAKVLLEHGRFRIRLIVRDKNAGHLSAVQRNDCDESGG